MFDYVSPHQQTNIMQSSTRSSSPVGLVSITNYRPVSATPSPPCLLPPCPGLASRKRVYSVEKEGCGAYQAECLENLRGTNERLQKRLGEVLLRLECVLREKVFYQNQSNQLRFQLGRQPQACCHYEQLQFCQSQLANPNPEAVNPFKLDSPPPSQSLPVSQSRVKQLQEIVVQKNQTIEGLRRKVDEVDGEREVLRRRCFEAEGEAREAREGREAGRRREIDCAGLLERYQQAVQENQELIKEHDKHVAELTTHLEALKKQYSNLKTSQSQQKAYQQSQLQSQHNTIAHLKRQLARQQASHQKQLDRMVEQHRQDLAKQRYQNCHLEAEKQEAEEEMRRARKERESSQARMKRAVFQELGEKWDCVRQRQHSMKEELLSRVHTLEKCFSSLEDDSCATFGLQPELPGIMLLQQD